MGAIVLHSGGLRSTAALVWARRAYGKDSRALVLVGASAAPEDKLKAASETARMLEVPVLALRWSWPEDLAPANEWRRGVTRLLPAMVAAAGSAAAMLGGVEAIVVGASAHRGGPPPGRQGLKDLEGGLRRLLGIGTDVVAPWLYAEAAEPVRFLRDVGRLDVAARSYSCHRPRAEFAPRPSCGDCPGCRDRLLAFEGAKTVDPATTAGVEPEVAASAAPRAKGRK